MIFIFLRKIKFFQIQKDRKHVYLYASLAFCPFSMLLQNIENIITQWTLIE